MEEGNVVERECVWKGERGMKMDVKGENKGCRGRGDGNGGRKRETREEGKEREKIDT